MTDATNQIQRVIEAMHGKDMTPQTHFIAESMHALIMKGALELAENEPDSPFRNDSFDGALRAVCIVAAIGRDEDNETPENVMTNIIAALAEDRKVRDETIVKLGDKAIANITAGVHVVNLPAPEATA
jgi:hypothetical protein